MPKMSDTMEEGVLVSWLAEEGASVSAGDVIAQVETDKATMDLEVYDDGVLLKRVVGEGDSVPIGALIAVLGSEGEDPSAIVGKYGGDGATEADAAPPMPAVDPPGDDVDTEAPAAASDAPAAGGDGAPVRTPPASAQTSQASAPSSEATSGRVKASPLARRMADEAGLDLGRIVGSGPDGRVVKRDIEAARGQETAAPTAAPVATPVAPASAPAPAAAPAATPSAGSDQRITQMRKAIGRRLAESKYSAPHFYLTVDIRMEEAMRFRADLNAHGADQGLAKISVNDLVTRACASALKRHPMVNASYLETDGVIRLHAGAHVAIAVAMPEGLITPVIRDADTKGLAAIAAETRELAGRARDGKLDPSEYAGSTFTTSNLGMFGISEFTAIINPPNACILAIGTIRDEPVVEAGEVVAGKVMTVTLSCDHRVVDGATGAAFLGDVKALIERPSMMLL